MTRVCTYSLYILVDLVFFHVSFLFTGSLNKVHELTVLSLVREESGILQTLHRHNDVNSFDSWISQPLDRRRFALLGPRRIPPLIPFFRYEAFPVKAGYSSPRSRF